MLLCLEALNYFCVVKEKLLHKRILAFVFASVYLLSLFKPLGAIIHYTVNYGLYANELCENKDKPELECNGTCAFAKKLNLNQDSESRPSMPLFENLDWYMALINTGELLNFSGSQKPLYFSHNTSGVKTPFIKLHSPPPIFLG